MQNSRKYYPLNVITNRGIIELRNIIPGDYVYEYRTGNKLKVMDIDISTYPSLLYYINYSDNRVEYVRDSDFVYTGNNIIQPNKIYTDNICKNNGIQFGTIQQYPVRLKNNINIPLDPDPYVTGAFLIYGDWTDKYVNLPDYMYAIHPVLNAKHSIVSHTIGPNDKEYFRYSGDTSYNPIITWRQLFGDNMNSVIKKYTMSSIKDRSQLIKGIFDMGYIPKLFGDNKVGIIGSSVLKLRIVQSVLWSLGISSKIEYDESIKLYKDNEFKLEIIGDYDGYPGFTNTIGNIEYLLKKDNEIISNEPKFSLKMKHNEYGLFTSFYGIMGNLVLEKPKSLYLSYQFLPRVSI